MLAIGQGCQFNTTVNEAPATITTAVLNDSYLYCIIYFFICIVSTLLALTSNNNLKPNPS